MDEFFSIFIQCEEETIEMVFQPMDSQDTDSVQAMMGGIPCLPHGKTPLALLRGKNIEIFEFLKIFKFFSHFSWSSGTASNVSEH